MDSDYDSENIPKIPTYNANTLKTYIGTGRFQNPTKLNFCKNDLKKSLIQFRYIGIASIII